jgi:hypothetical protein
MLIIIYLKLLESTLVSSAGFAIADLNWLKMNVLCSLNCPAAIEYVVAQHHGV